MTKWGRCDILGIGAPIIDYLLFVTDEYLTTYPGQKGGSILVDYPTLQSVIRGAGSPPTLVCGGSAANVIKGLAKLGCRCGFAGRIGSDSAGAEFKKMMEKHKITPHLLEDSLPTAQAACLISPDYDRTMCAFLGASLKMEAADLTPNMFEGVQLVHLEGYLLTRGDLVYRAVKLAKESGAEISLDCSSPEIVTTYKETILSLLKNNIDIVFATVREVKALTGLDPKPSCQILRELCKIVTVTMGVQGCWAVNKEEIIFHPAFKVDTVDTTGAGDLFDSGFLSAYLEKKTLTECAKRGAFVASHVVQAVGAEIPENVWPAIISGIKNQDLVDPLHETTSETGSSKLGSG